MNSRLRITILGSGTSVGVPTIGCKCEICTSKDPKDKRQRSSIMVENLETNERLVVDTTPDFRNQMLQNDVTHLKDILYTHTHADHCHGFDDIRVFYFEDQKPMNCYLLDEHIEEFKSRFSYVFSNTGYSGVKPQIELKVVPDQEFKVCGLDVESIRLPHGHMNVAGYRFGDFAYITDFKEFSDEKIAAWKGKIRVMAASGLRFKSHPTHSTVDETVDLFKKLGVEKGYITHLSHDVGYERDASKLPENVKFAFDGLQFEV